MASSTASKGLVDAFLGMQTNNSMAKSSLAKSRRRLIFFLRFVNGSNFEGDDSDVFKDDDALAVTMASAKRITDAKYHEYLNRIVKPSTHNTHMIYLNQVRKFIGKPKLERKRQKIPDKEPLDLDSCETMFQKMMDAARCDRDRVILALLRHEGLRENEICLLKKENFKYFDDHLTLHFYRPKTKKWGDIIISNDIHLIEQYVRSTGDILFPSETHGGIPMTPPGIWYMVHSLAKKIGVDWHAHAFRHFSATELGVKGLTREDLNNQYGWSPRSNTAAIYVNLSNSVTQAKKAAKNGVDIARPVEVAKVKTKCRHCGAVLDSDEIKGGRCPVCQFSTNPAETIKEIKSREELQAKNDALEAKLLALELKIDRLIEARDAIRPEDVKNAIEAKREYEKISPAEVEYHGLDPREPGEGEPDNE